MLRCAGAPLFTPERSESLSWLKTGDVGKPSIHPGHKRHALAVGHWRQVTTPAALQIYAFLFARQHLCFRK